MQPKVSIIIRTCGRPQVLRTALNSIRKQTYRNIEIVIVEDGIPTSKEMIEKEYSDLFVRYQATEEKVGRSRAGNIGLKIATGEFCNFLDDDDMLYPNHIKKLVQLLNGKSELAAYAFAEECQFEKSIKPYKIQVRRKLVRYRYPFNRLLLFYTNYLPIQCVMFSRKLFLEAGGLAENMDGWEDWDMWVRYAMCTNFLCISQVTSRYFVPFKGKEKTKRDMALRGARQMLEERFKQYKLEIKVLDINKEMDYIVNKYKKRNITIYMRKIRDFLLYRDI